MTTASCRVVARDGAPTTWAARSAPQGEFGTAILASGTNDATAPDLERRLTALRLAVHAQRVVWVLPYSRRAAMMVRTVAGEREDRWLDLYSLPSADRVHPHSYRPIAITLGRLLTGQIDVDHVSGADSSRRDRWVIAPTTTAFAVFR